MPESVPTMDEFLNLSQQVLALKAKVEGLEYPDEVKAALVTILNWMLTKITEADAPT